jgi:hypothetical protein
MAARIANETGEQAGDHGRVGWWGEEAELKVRASS